MRLCLAFVLGVLDLVAFSHFAQAEEPEKLRLSLWERGVAFQAPQDPDMKVYLWFYEWNMFEARSPGQHTHGTIQKEKKINESATRVEIGPENLRLVVEAGVDYADLSLTIVNDSMHNWPEIAAIIPCFNPGPPKHSERGQYADKQNVQFANTRTYFHGPCGLERLMRREIHFNDRLRQAVNLQAKNGEYVFSEKWPTGKANARSGILIRESTNRRWVTAIAWEEFLSAQAHNPWECMHLSVRVGSLKAGEKRTIKGKVYLFQGSKEDCFKRYEE